MSTRTPLDVIEIKDPCPASWEQMRGDDRARFCARCDRHVHDLSAMPAEDAERLVCQAAGPLCVRFARSADGKVVTLEYQKSSRLARPWRFWTLLGFAGAAAAALANVLLFKPKPRVNVIMGAISPIRVTTPAGPGPSPGGAANTDHSDTESNQAPAGN